ncbi:uncharacterized protein (DUF302 family) [Algoriphagus boseongensis]|uniref:Uncharacterized protein (DUF302 family) n=1 Tax=Algoriphagus boseongensis TaxID=1442587 RepID=A0A4R6T7I7_9BACT|nr:DUF302 domain-containing protein [Algoriphagus boseongensis]TDQ17195.1 uncharacterized protein (DUF302 family) [Algoriphagus boseongensis]
MSYYFSKILPGKTFEEAKELVTEELKKEGFGILTEIDVQATLKKKIDADINRYTILGACNPQFAYKAVTTEDKIGVFLPCNVLVKEQKDGQIEVVAVDPIASMSAVQNDSLGSLATEVQSKLKRVIENLG